MTAVKTECGYTSRDPIVSAATARAPRIGRTRPRRRRSPFPRCDLPHPPAAQSAALAEKAHNPTTADAASNLAGFMAPLRRCPSPSSHLGHLSDLRPPTGIATRHAENAAAVIAATVRPAR